jgi:hypothetical protein
MISLPQDILATLQANGRARRNADRDGMSSLDPVPGLKLFNPLGPATWLATELGADGDTLFGLADLGFGCPELGTFSLSEIGAIRLPFGLGIERDTAFATSHRLSLWAAWTRRTGSLMRTETLLRHTLWDAEVRGLDLDRAPG